MIFVIDDDASVRTALARLIASAGHEAETFASAEEFLASNRPSYSDCLVVDIHLGGMSGLELQRELVQADSLAPIIFITAFDSAEVRREAKRAGADAYFRKPFDDQALLDAIDFALDRVNS